MKKLFALIALVAFVGMTSYAQTATTGTKKDPKKKEAKAEVKNAEAMTDAPAATGSDKVAPAEGCKEHSAKTEKSCEKSAGGSCCQKGTAAGGSCCQKGGGTASEGKTEMAPTTEGKKRSRSKTVAVVNEKK